MACNGDVRSEYKLTIDGETAVTVKADREMTAGEALMYMIDALMREEANQECTARFRE